MSSVNDLSQSSRKRVNDQLLRIKQEMQNDSVLSDYESSDIKDELLQPMPQQFYQEFDNEFEGKPRVIYVSCLLRKCSNVYIKRLQRASGRESQNA